MNSAVHPFPLLASYVLSHIYPQIKYATQHPPFFSVSCSQDWKRDAWGISTVRHKINILLGQTILWAILWSTILLVRSTRAGPPLPPLSSPGAKGRPCCRLQLLRLLCQVLEQREPRSTTVPRTLAKNMTRPQRRVGHLHGEFKGLYHFTMENYMMFYMMLKHIKAY